jgi:hypothetical protein
MMESPARIVFTMASWHRAFPETFRHREAVPDGKMKPLISPFRRHRHFLHRVRGGVAQECVIKKLRSLARMPLKKQQLVFYGPTRYRYYVSTSLVTGAGRNRSSGRRIPAGNLEGMVINRLRTFLADPGAILDAIDNESPSGTGRSHLIERGRQVAEELGGPAPDKVKATLMTLLCRVEIRSDCVEIALSRGRLTQLLAGSLDLKMRHQEPTNAPDDILRLTVPVGLKRVFAIPR